MQESYRIANGYDALEKLHGNNCLFQYQRSTLGNDATQTVQICQPVEGRKKLRTVVLDGSDC